MQLLSLNSVDRNCVEKFTFSEDEVILDAEDLFKPSDNAIEIKIDLNSNDNKMNLKKIKNNKKSELCLNMRNSTLKLNEEKMKTAQDSSSSLDTFEGFDETDNEIFKINSKLDSSSNVVSNAVNNGYCVDSVEPKCNEIKRLIDEFKTNYLSKFGTIKNNRVLTHKLNSVSKILCRLRIRRKKFRKKFFCSKKVRKNSFNSPKTTGFWDAGCSYFLAC